MTHAHPSPLLPHRTPRTLQRCLVGVLTLLLMMALGSAPAATLRAADEKAVITVVQSQLAAFAADDAQKAFSFAAPAIQKMFETAPNFLAMVRQQYPVVYRPASTVFLKPETRDGQVVLRVQLTDADGRAWLAAYSLQQVNRQWRIAGCVVVVNEARST